MSVGAILLAGGTGKRLGLDVEKPLVPLGGRPLFAWSLEALERCDAIQGIVVVGPPGRLDEMLTNCGIAAVKVVADAMMGGASIAAIPLEDTLKRGTLHRIDATVPRTGLWRAQTPQVFRRDWLTEAHAGTRGAATDDAMMVEACGHPVRIIAGDSLNFKVTNPRDLSLAAAWLTARATDTP